MDGHRVAEHIMRPSRAHLHGKDTSFNEENLALNGVLDHRWPHSPELDALELFGSWPGPRPVMVGRSDSAASAASPAKVVSIEHEDPFVPASVGVPEAARLLSEAISLANKEAKKNDDLSCCRDGRARPDRTARVPDSRIPSPALS